MLARTLEQVQVNGKYPVRRHHFNVFLLHHHEYFLRYHLPSMWKAVPEERTDEKALWGHPSAWRVPLSGGGLWQGSTHLENLKLQFYMSYNITMRQCKCHDVSDTNVSQVFTSKNKMSSHRSRNCNPNKDRRKTLWESFAVLSLWCPSIFQWNTFGLVHFKSYSCPNYSFLPEKVHLLSFIDVTFVLIYNFVCLSHSSGIQYNLKKRRCCPCPYIT